MVKVLYNEEKVSYSTTTRFVLPYLKFRKVCRLYEVGNRTDYEIIYIKCFREKLVASTLTFQSLVYAGYMARGEEIATQLTSPAALRGYSLYKVRADLRINS